MDSGASDTMFISKTSFNDYKVTTPRSGDSAKAVSGEFEIIGEGTVIKRYLVDGKEKKITYTRAIHTPSLNANLISVSAFDRAGLTIIFEGGCGVVRKKDGTIVLTARCENGMYVVNEVDNDLPGMEAPLTLVSISQPTSLEQWHCHLSHCSPLTITEMTKLGLVDGLKVLGTDLQGRCEDCVLGRQTCRPFNGVTEKDLHPLKLVSFDLWGLSRVQSAGGKIYFMPIVDGGTSYKYGAYLSDKSDSSTIAAFDVFRVEAESMSGHKVRRLRTDRAYDTSAWGDYCQKNGITHEFTAPYSSAQNGLAERAIRTTTDDMRTLLCDSGLGHSYWAEAAAYSIYTRNLIPSCRHPGKIPLESFTGKRQDVSHLRSFGTKCWAKIPTVHGVQVTDGSKLDPQGVECRFLGYASGRGNYKVQDVTSRRVFVSCDVIFEEGNPHHTLPSVGEKNLPLFDTMTNEDNPLDDDVDQDNKHPNTSEHLNNHDRHVDNPAEPIIPMEPIQQTIEPRHSSCIPQPSNNSLNSWEYQQREESG